MTEIRWIEDKEEIMIDNTELLRTRADVDEEGVYEAEERRVKAKEEQKLTEDKIRTGWSEPTRKLEVKHKCPVCGVIFYGRRNKVYCSPRCANTARMRRIRQRQREIRDFEPHRDKYGGIKILTYNPETKKEVITSVPMFYAKDLTRALHYIDTHFDVDEKVKDDYKEQVKEVFANEDR